MEDSDKINILKEIKSAEESSEKITESAKRKAEMIIADAQKFASKLVNDKKKEILKKLQAEQTLKSSELENKRNKILKNAEQSALKLEEIANENSDTAVDFICKKFEEYLE